MLLVHMSVNQGRQHRGKLECCHHLAGLNVGSIYPLNYLVVLDAGLPAECLQTKPAAVYCKHIAGMHFCLCLWSMCNRRMSKPPG